MSIPPAIAAQLVDVLDHRPATLPPDPVRENEVLDRLMAMINRSPDRAFEALTTVTTELISGGSAGVSLLQGDSFHWPAIAGQWAQYVGGGLPADALPCGMVIERDRPLLVIEPHRAFPTINVEPRIREALLVPLRFGGRPEGTLWVLSHDDRQFNARDAQVLERLGLFAAAIEDARRSYRLATTSNPMSRTMALIRTVIRRAYDDASEKTAEETLHQLGDRIDAFAAVTHQADDAIGVDLWLLLADALVRYAEPPGDRIILEGPTVSLPVSHVGLFRLAFRELIDNAYRHGALGRPNGRVHATWSLREMNARPVLDLTWRESGVPVDLTSQLRSGFGFDLLQRGLPAQTGAECQLDLQQDGMSFYLRQPLPD